MSSKLDTSEADLQWLLGELDRVWFHDNALTFHMGDWIRSLRRSSSWPIDANSLDSGAPMISDRGVELQQKLARTLRESGKVFSTGDLPKARKNEQDESSEATAGGASPDSISEQGAEDYHCDEEFRRLETIPSSSDLTPFTPPPAPKTIHETTVTVSAATTPALPRRRRRKQRRKQTRSLSELEFDELRGFRDLGFKFTKDDMTPRVVGLVQPHGYTRESQANKKSSSSNTPGVDGRSNKVERERIYPSHAWSIRRPDSPLLNLRLPDPNEEGVDMKAHLKFWARTVASTVRQEC